MLAVILDKNCAKKQIHIVVFYLFTCKELKHKHIDINNSKSTDK
jgi:hypothetical protein